MKSNRYAASRSIQCSLVLVLLAGSLRADAGADFLRALRAGSFERARTIFLQHQNRASNAFEAALFEANPAAARSYRRGAYALQPLLKNYALTEMVRLDGKQLAALYVNKKLGWDAWEKGRLSEARHNFSKALQIAEANSWSWQQEHLSFLIAYTLADEGRFSDSNAWLEIAWKCRNPQRSNHLDAMIRENLGHNAHKQGNLDLALERYHEAMDLHTSLQYSEGMATAANNLGALYQEGGNFSAALAHYQRCRSALDPDSRNIPIVENNMAGCLLELNRNDEADAILVKPLNAQSPGYFQRLSLRQRYLRAAGRKTEASALSRFALQHARTKRNTALLSNAVCDALDGSSSVREASGFLNEAASLIPADDPNRWKIDFLLARLWYRDGDPRRAEPLLQSAFSTLQQRGSRSYFEFNFAARVLELMRVWVSVLVQQGKISQALQIWEMGKSMARGKPAPDLYAFQQSLGPNCLAIDYCVSEDRTVAWIIKRGSLTCVTLRTGESELASRVQSLRLPLLSAVNLVAPPYRREISKQLHEILVAPLEEPLRGGNCWTILRDGALHAIPFEMLETRDGKSLLERAVVRYWDTLHPFEGTTQTLRNFTVWQEGPFADQAFFPARSQVARSWDEARLAKGDVLHYAGHSLLDEAFPALSTLSARGRVTAQRISQVHLPYRLVVLNSCESAGEVGGFGNGLVGLSSAFQVAGARQVIATLWPIDQHSSFVLSELYRPPMRESELAQNFRRVRLRFRRTSYRVGPHLLQMSNPYFWGPYILIAPHAPHPPSRHGDLTPFLFPLVALTTRYCIHRRRGPKG
jgi:CHAT domain-containing protein